MSQLPSDPPPLPVVPITAQPMYASRPVQSRPGAIGFMGITSIIVASLCIFAGIGFGLMDLGLVMAGSAAKTMASMPPAPVPIVFTGSGGSAERLPADGLAANDRHNVSDGLVRVRSLSPSQLQQLDALLAEHGKTVVPSAALLTLEQIAASVSGSRHLLYTGTAGSDSFVLGDGRLELSDDRAVFFPTNGQPPLRANALLVPPGNAYTTAGLQPQQIQSILRTIDDLNGSRIKSAQMNALISTFQNPGQQIIVPTTDGSDPAWQINSATTDTNGTLAIACNHGSTYTAINCLADGTIGQSSASSTSFSSMAAMPTVEPKAALAALGMTLLQFVLAVFLLIAGIVTLRSSPRGRMMHWIYVALKLPIAAMTAAASGWMWNSLIRSVPTGGSAMPAAAISSVSLSMGIVPVALVCLYPIALIFVLLSGSVRSYYSTVRAG